MTSPVPATPPELRSPRIHRHMLPNGLKLLIVEKHDLPIVDVQLVMRTGAAVDVVRHAGWTSLATDMLDEGTTSMTALDIAERVEDLGASLYSSAGWDDSGIGVHVHAERLTPALELLADIALNPAFPAADFERKKQERLTALLQDREEPRILASNEFNAIIFGETHPYGKPLHGTRSSVSTLQRDDMVAFHDQFIRPGNAFMVVAGDVITADLLTVIERLFGGWAGAAGERVETPRAASPVATSFHIVDRPGSAQSELRVGRVGADRNTPDYFPLLVMNTVLGGSFTSRLNLNLRQDKGYTYGAASSVGFRRAPGPLLASTAVDTAVTADAIRQILLEMGRLREEPVPDEELARAQNYLALGLPRSFETTSDIANHIAEIELYGLGDSYFDEYVRRVRAVTASDVQRVAHGYLDPSASVVVIAGDVAAIEMSLRALEAGPVMVRPVED